MCYQCKLFLLCSQEMCDDSCQHESSQTFLGQPFQTTEHQFTLCLKNGGLVVLLLTYSSCLCVNMNFQSYIQDTTDPILISQARKDDSSLQPCSNILY